MSGRVHDICHLWLIKVFSLSLSLSLSQTPDADDDSDDEDDQFGAADTYANYKPAKCKLNTPPLSPTPTLATYFEKTQATFSQSVYVSSIDSEYYTDIHCIVQ